MRVNSKLAQIDFQFGKVAREGNLLLIKSDANSTMKSSVYVSPEDVVEFLKRFFVSPSAILFVLGLPWFFYRWRKSGRKQTSAAGRQRKPWPTV
ncbi:MAG TPA: hypothetical protein PKK10_08765 [Woeseiaceae bacterium]|nr:hypothetical protein [Woeseiaceae bacterium]